MKTKAANLMVETTATVVTMEMSSRCYVIRKSQRQILKTIIQTRLEKVI